MARLGPPARTGTPAQAAESSDLVVVATPVSTLSTLPVAALRGKIVVDVNNHLAEREEMGGSGKTPA